MKRNQAKDLLRKTDLLSYIHGESARKEHAIMQGNEWEPYIPTRFIYSFFTFNTLYNIDWKLSLERRNLYNFNSAPTEGDKYTKYLDFCCNEEEDDFLIEYKDFFIRYVTANFSPDFILEELKKIQLDRKYSRGGINEQGKIDDFITACEKCLKGNCLSKDILKCIIDFIYKIRCNLFHGVKTMQDLQSEHQQIRLNIYSTFIVAINQMVFSYLEYLRGDDITEGFDSLLKRLEWNPTLSSHRSNHRFEIEEEE